MGGRDPESENGDPGKYFGQPVLLLQRDGRGSSGPETDRLEAKQLRMCLLSKRELRY